MRDFANDSFDRDIFRAAAFQGTNCGQRTAQRRRRSRTALDDCDNCRFMRKPQHSLRLRELGEDCDKVYGYLCSIGQRDRLFATAAFNPASRSKKRRFLGAWHSFRANRSCIEIRAPARIPCFSGKRWLCLRPPDSKPLP